MKSLLPWVLALALLGAAAFLFLSNRKQAEELSALRTESQQAQALRAEVEQIKASGSPAQSAEIAQLKKDNQELLKLRNENRQLRDDKKQLSQQAQTAQVQAQQAQAQVQAAQAQAQQAAQALATQQQAGAAKPLVVRSPEQLANDCINNLRQIDGAIQQWALENKKTVNDVVTAKDIAPYLKDGGPKCPAGGTYKLSTVAAVPTCTIPGHALPTQ